MRIITLFGCVIVVVVAVGAVLLMVQKPIHATEVVVDRALDEVWSWLSDPLKYDRLYPNWIKRVQASADGTFKVDDQFGQSYPVRLVLNRELGIVDLHINLPTGKEVSRSRLYSVTPEKTAIANLAHRWGGANAVIWFFHKRNTDRDFENAKRVIEAGG